MSVRPPRPIGPPLTALRAFEAAARLGGFAAAAEELSVSAGAVAQQIRSLEDWAGAPLFERKPQGVELNANGQLVLPQAVAAFDQLTALVQAIRQVSHPHQVRLAALPAIAQLWLSPRLPKLRAAFPELEISLTALESAPNLTRDPYDATLFYQGGDGADTLAPDEIFPVCAPSIAARLDQVADLGDVPCLLDTTWSEDWTLWLRHAAPLKPPRIKGPSFSLYALAVQEAINGAGVVMGHRSLIAPDLAAGRLVAPFSCRVDTGQALVWRMRQPQDELLTQVVTFLSESRL